MKSRHTIAKNPDTAVVFALVVGGAAASGPRCRTNSGGLQPPEVALRARLHALILTAAVFLFMGAGDDSARFKDLGHRMMCTCGCGQVLLECNHVGCQSSEKMRNELLAALDKGDIITTTSSCKASCRNTDRP